LTILERVVGDESAYELGQVRQPAENDAGRDTSATGSTGESIGEPAWWKLWGTDAVRRCCERERQHGDTVLAAGRARAGCQLRGVPGQGGKMALGWKSALLGTR